VVVLRILPGFARRTRGRMIGDAMTDEIKTLSIQARKLSPSERLQLVDDILASLDEPDPNIDRLWAKEAEERLAAHRRGEIKAIPLEQVLAKYRGK
jgi:putative addiction module component (TIGR02574 family)